MGDLSYLRVLRVSSMWVLAGLIVANMAVFEFPPKLSFNILVQLKDFKSFVRKYKKNHF